MQNLKRCKTCGLPEDARGVVDDGIFINEVNFYLGRGAADSQPVVIKLNQNSICQICSGEIKKFKPLKEGMK